MKKSKEKRVRDVVYLNWLIKSEQLPIIGSFTSLTL